MDRTQGSDTRVLTRPRASGMLSPKDWLISRSWGCVSPSRKTWWENPKTLGSKKIFSQQQVHMSFDTNTSVPGKPGYSYTTVIFKTQEETHRTMKEMQFNSNWQVIANMHAMWF